MLFAIKNRRFKSNPNWKFIDQKLPGDKFNHKLNFDYHLTVLFKKESAKLQALARIPLYMGLVEKKLLFDSIFATQFMYCLLLQMIHNRLNSNRNENI